MPRDRQLYVCHRVCLTLARLMKDEPTVGTAAEPTSAWVVMVTSRNSTCRGTGAQVWAGCEHRPMVRLGGMQDTEHWTKHWVKQGCRANGTWNASQQCAVRCGAVLHLLRPPGAATHLDLGQRHIVLLDEAA